MNELPQYDDEKINTFRVVQAQTLALGEAYQGYSQAVKNLIEAHNHYLAKPNVKSRYYAYQAALNNIESLKSLIHELKDDFYNSNLSDWIP